MKKKYYDFSDIKALSGDSFREAIKYMANDEETLKGVRKFLKTEIPSFFGPVYDKYFIRKIKTYLMSFKDVDSFQRHFISDKILAAMFKHSVDNFSFEGIEKLDPAERYLFVSNHRDIVLDPTLFNFALLESGYKTAQIAFGDNLIYNKFVENLIRCNKGFVVKRNLPIKEQLTESLKLSAYINQVLGDGESVWIAQRSGRAKDGNDFTRTAVLKMFYLSLRKKMSFHEYVKWAKIVPVSISYEFDPCDVRKAIELADPEYRKSKLDDMHSIRLGIEKKKGNIRITFGDVLTDEYKKPKQLAAELDRQIISNYHLWPTNYIAYDILNSSSLYRKKYTTKQKSEFLKRYSSLDSEVLKFVLHQYANPVMNKNLVDNGEKNE